MLGESFDLAKLTGPEGQPLIDDSAGLAGLLLREPAVQLELKLTNPQKEQLARGARSDKVLDAQPAQPASSRSCFKARVSRL